MVKGNLKGRSRRMWGKEEKRVGGKACRREGGIPLYHLKRNDARARSVDGKGETSERIVGGILEGCLR